MTGAIHLYCFSHCSVETIVGILRLILQKDLSEWSCRRGLVGMGILKIFNAENEHSST